MRDSSPDVEQRRLAVVSGLDPSVRLRRALDASELTRQLALTRLRALHPGLTQRELVACWLHQTFPALRLPALRR